MVDQDSGHLDTCPCSANGLQCDSGQITVFLSLSFLIWTRKLKTSVLGWSPGPALDLPCELGWVPLPPSVVFLPDEGVQCSGFSLCDGGMWRCLDPSPAVGNFLSFQATWFSVPDPHTRALPSSVLSTSSRASISPAWYPGNRLFTGWQR